MKVRKRITIAFTGIYSSIVVPLCIVIYLTAQNNRKDIFFNLLNERVEITEQFFLESDKLSDELRDQMRNSFLQTLPNEIEYIEEERAFDRNLPDSVRQMLPGDFRTDQLDVQEDISWSINKKQGVAKKYRIGSYNYIVVVIAEDVYGHAYIKQLGYILLIALFLTITMAFVLSNYFARQILKPIAGKINKANRISAKNLDLRLTVYNEKDELGMLAISFNNLLDRLEGAFELEKNFIKYASHEIKNPLTVIIGESELALAKERSINEYIEALEIIRSTAFSLNGFISNFLELSKLDNDKIAFAPVRIDELILDAMSISNEYSDKDLSVKLEIQETLSEEELTVNANEFFVKNALDNLIHNARKFSHDGGEIQIILQKTNGRLRLKIKDKGIGIPEDDIPLIFNPLYRGGNAKDVKGTGLGLALTKKIMDLHNFEIHIDSTVGEGTSFSIDF
jgi:signal transduction histidine kinase